jgi:zinc transport system permease protein
MAFFSDALAHCAFAGVALGILLALVFGTPLTEIRESRYLITFVMIGFGIIVGVLIAFVRENTALSNDTVIGVFFAGAMGLGAMLLKAVSSRGYFNLENFLFGEPSTATAQDIELLLGLVILIGIFLCLLYNDMVFASFSPSLARSRRVPTRLAHYLFIVLLGIIVNLSIQIVGALLINGLLIVPAATAANVSTNMRQFFRRSVVIALLVGVGGYWLSLILRIPDPPREPLGFGIGGTIVVLSVLAFALSMLVRPASRLAKRPFTKSPRASPLHNPPLVPTMAKNEPRGVPPA